MIRGVLSDHGDFLAYDVAFQIDFVFGESGVPDHIGEDFDEDGHQFRLALGFVNGVVFGGAGIGLAAAGFDGEGEFFRGAGRGALEGHVLRKVREACGDVSRFIAGADRDVDGERGALGFREMRVGEAGAAGEIVGGVGGWHERYAKR